MRPVFPIRRAARTLFWGAGGGATLALILLGLLAGLH